tara:strand:+ start:752 stop:1246 length:495 start_codon:yes stop_codon:yes gene_type:complete
MPWELLGSNSTVSSNALELSFTAKSFIQIEGSYKQGAGTSGAMRLRLGNTTLDTGSNYSERTSEDGGAEVTTTSQNEFKYSVTDGSGAVNYLGYFNIYIINDATEEKLIISQVVTNVSAGASQAPRRLETVGKWDNTSNQIDIISLYRTADTLTSGNLTVFGTD